MIPLKDFIVGIVGGGTVGAALARSYVEHVREVRVYDVVRERATASLEATLQSDIVFVCLPTPAGEGGKCNTLAIDRFLETAGEIHPSAHLVLRSTVPVGYTDQARKKYKLERLCFSPEFLTARCATVDAQVPARNIIGVSDHERFDRSHGCTDRLNQLYSQRFPNCPVLSMTAREAEAVKLFQNAFFAVKVAFWNEMYEFTQTANLRWDTILRGVLTDGRVHPSHTQVPGPDGKRGFGGACLPKDLDNLISCMLQAGCTSPVLDAAAWRNAHVDRKEK